jgi:hypothetical protein
VSISVLEQKHVRAARKFFLRSLLIIPTFAAGVGALTASFAPLFFHLKQEDSLAWALTGGVSVFVLVGVALYFLLQPKSAWANGTLSESAE